MALQIVSICVIVTLIIATGALLAYWIYHGHRMIYHGHRIPILETRQIVSTSSGTTVQPVEQVQPFYMDIVQQRGPGDRYLILPKNELANREKLYKGVQNLSEYETEPWSFRVYTTNGSGSARESWLQEWCVFVQNRQQPNFTIYRSGTSEFPGNIDLCSKERSDETRVFSFWTPKALAPNLVTVRVERNLSDPKQPRFRIRHLEQPVEASWEPFGFSENGLKDRSSWKQYIALITPRVTINS